MSEIPNESLRQRQETFAAARVYLDGVGWGAVTEAGKNPQAWVDGLAETYSRGRMVAAVLHGLGVQRVNNWGNHHWFSAENARQMGVKIGRYRGLMMTSKLRPPTSPGKTLGWLLQLLDHLGLDVDQVEHDGQRFYRVRPLTLGQLLQQSEPTYQRFLPRGQYTPNLSEVSFLHVGVPWKPELTARFVAELVGGEE